MRASRQISLSVLSALATAATFLPAAQAADPLPGVTTRIVIRDVGGEEAGFWAFSISPDGRSFLMATTSSLVPSDTNNVLDIYVQDRATREIELISLASNGAVANGASRWPEMSHDGRYVAFQSDATNLAAGDTNAASDVFVRDRAAGTTTVASVSTQGGVGDRASTGASVSDDGRYVAFLSSATNLVPNDTNLYADVFVRDIVAGTTERVSVMSGGGQGLFNPEGPEISGNGRSVVFAAAFPYDPRDTNAPSRDVYVHDRVTRETTRVSVASDGSEGPLASFYPTIADDGRKVAFSSFNPNYVPYDTNGYSETFVHDLGTGRTQRLVGPDGQQGNGVVGVPVISADARFITANFLPSNYGYQDANGSTDVYRFDRLTGHVDLVSTTPEGVAGDAISYSPSISADGRFVTFFSEATDIVADGEGGGLFLRDLGPPLGTGALTATSGDGKVHVAGWTRLGAEPFVRVADPGTDAGLAARNAGAEIIGAQIVYRPERGDLHGIVELAPRQHPWPPLVGTDYPKPGAMTYGFALKVDGVSYEARAVLGAGQSFALYRCSPACAKVADLSGGIGTASDDVRISIPLAALGVSEGTVFDGGAFVSPGETTTGPVATLDQVPLPRTEIPIVRVDLGLAPQGTSRGGVSFNVRASLANGAFSGDLDLPGGGKHEAWARVCVGDECFATWTPIA